MGPTVLVVLDGWGHATTREGNAVRNCGPANMDALARDYPSSLLDASGVSVGLPAGQIGNSEVGHTCMGAGRIVYQDLNRIGHAIATREFQSNPALLAAMDGAARGGRALHLLGLVSDGGVHSHIDHLEVLVKMARERGCLRIFVHAFMDGRDTAPAIGVRYLRDLEETFARDGGGAAIGTVMGRYWAMDRDNRWDRVQRAYEAMTEGVGLVAPTGVAAMEAAYGRAETDEFVAPTIVSPAGIAPGAAPGLLRDGDAVIFFNFRADRAREITRALTEGAFDAFPRRVRPALSSYTCMTRYHESFPLPVAFPPEFPDRTFGQLLAERGLRQLRLAETEKYAHVTFFFNGGVERVFPGEERVLIPSPRVATYDLQPAMSAPAVTDAFVEKLRAFDRIPGGANVAVVMNFANADMVGHTGIYEAALSACRTIDECVGRIAGETLAREGTILITADHGNAEQMIDPETGGPHTAHTLNPVPVILAGRRFRGMRLREGGILPDIAPTLLEAMGIPQPAEMTGRTLLDHT
ncbi:MAG: 2,3-bisphosphoglycerate-independent phosphoglycerate mutase [Acidobacteria bacterium]|nr:2,3-bisphosphoglycerate-independent phosphoglycerate mutase [Acidobacteriota bacterium]